MHRLGLLIATSVVALGVVSAAAAHGDPTIHYLETELLLSSYASPPTQALDLQLLGLLQASERRGYPIKVSLIASVGDTADDPAPLRSPQRYAERVSAALELVRELRAPVLIVTPRGLGVAGNELRGGRLRPIRGAGARALVAGVELPREAQGDDLARAAMVAVRRLARAGGRPLPAYVPPAKTISPAVVAGRARDEGSGGAVDVWLVAAVLGSLPLLGWMLYEVSTRASRRRPA